MRLIAGTGDCDIPRLQMPAQDNLSTLFNDEAIVEIADAHNKTSAQVILRWHLQAGNIAIPGSSNEAHIQENYEIFDFELTEDEVQRMTALDRNERLSSY